MPENNFPVPDFREIHKLLMRDVFVIAERESVAFFKESFDKGGFTDESFKAWDNRNEPDYRPGGKLMVATRYLYDSIEVAEKDRTSITIGSYAPYAEIHNEGGTLKIPITPQSRKFFWYMYKKTENPKWKTLALTKQTHITTTMQQRQFMGPSAKMMEQMDDQLKAQILHRFKNLKTI